VKIAPALAVIAALPVLSAQTAASAPTPQGIYAKAIGKVRTYATPAYAVWHSDWTVTTEDGVTTHHAQLMAARTADGMEVVMGLPEEMPGTHLNLPPGTFVGEAFSWPFAWGAMGARPPGPHASETTMVPDLSAPAMIAHVTAREAPPYALELVGIEDAGERRAYHVRLRPLVDPERHNLRDLWIDAETFDVLVAHFVSRYSPRPGATESPSDVTEYFAMAAQYRIAWRIVFTYDNQYVSERSDATIANVAFPASLPDWLFDQGLFDQQRRAGTPNILWDILNGEPATPPPG
jgi:hypothetical protein